uniref:Ubiquitin-like protease family profile domain-containing protein n=1 Tax=Globisporangium ultimum (strain ATCC 200006 / CBS 805.95 / DAOM BR144) TaxID=431595 RepID=K3WNY6_GLOUD
MQDKWNDQLESYLKKWHAASRETTTFPEVTEEYILQPKQTDGSSCGVMLIGQVYFLLREEYTFQRQVSTADYVQVMRLRILWLILCKSIVENPAGVDVEKTNLEL